MGAILIDSYLAIASLFLKIGDTRLLALTKLSVKEDEGANWWLKIFFIIL